MIYIIIGLALLFSTAFICSLIRYKKVNKIREKTINSLMGIFPYLKIWIEYNMKNENLVVLIKIRDVIKDITVNANITNIPYNVESNRRYIILAVLEYIRRYH